MRFALDRANPGWSPGRWGGLLGETSRAERVLERLLAVAAPDGLLPETYDSDTGTWLARHWFAWPSAALAAVALGDAPCGIGC